MHIGFVFVHTSTSLSCIHQLRFRAFINFVFVLTSTSIFFVVSHVGHHVGHLVGHLDHLHVGHHVLLYVGHHVSHNVVSTLSTLCGVSETLTE